MKNGTVHDKGVYTGFAVLLTVLSAVFLSASILGGAFPSGHDIMLAAVAIMAWCLSALHPHFRANDERWHRIRERGMFYSYFILLGFLLALMAVFSFTNFDLDGYRTVSVVASFLISSVFLTFVVLSKRM